MTRDFLKYRYAFFAISLIIIISGITYGLITGYTFDIDFKGGTTIKAELKEEYDNNEISQLVSDITNTSVLVQKTTSGDNSVSITTDAIDQDTSDKVIEALKERYTNMDEPSVRNVQPSYGKELLNSAIVALIIAIIIMLIYIFVRFKTLGFTAAITAIITLIHDALFIVAIYGFIKFPINSSFVAVILTIIGYSINDTIIVYDRIRENKKLVSKSSDLKDTINTSISQTMNRTICTSLTTVAAILTVYVFALVNDQQVLKEFSLPLIIGVLVGTYSSVCIASSLWYTIEEFLKKHLKKDSKNKRK
ncbi:MAG: protein translocase subunit SecF [Clostridia bacterium]|nr:protein translocase subunit SecF [Clostridia bacterium]